MRNLGWVCCPVCNEVVQKPGEDQIRTPFFVATCTHCGLVFDWRLSGGMDFLRGAVFRWEEYVAPSEVWDHDHCAFCGQKFMEVDDPGIHRFGYVCYSQVQEWWVCRDCFEDFREELDLRVESTEDVS
ncbi:MAG: hypothetical protein L0215_04210 [Gemmataceae bacterium]|nr:hypothetical protein [Gemmataceae bacterium]